MYLSFNPYNIILNVIYHFTKQRVDRELTYLRDLARLGYRDKNIITTQAVSSKNGCHRYLPGASKKQ